MPTLWLISPVPLWVSAGHGQIESLTILAIVLSLDLLLCRRPLLAGVVAGLGIGVEYLPALVAIVVIFWLYVSAIERRELSALLRDARSRWLSASGRCFQLYRPHEPSRRARLFRSAASHPGTCKLQAGLAHRCGRCSACRRALLAGCSVVHVTRAHDRAST